MARGNHASPPARSPLPKVEFEIIRDEKLKLPGGVHDHQARSFGYNEFSHYTKPEHYIRHVEPLESDLARTVEYDMDEQDQEWLQIVNTDRKKAQLDAVTQEQFEIIMDRLEKEWFDLTKNIPKQDFAMPSEDSTCAVCDDSEGENSNAIVFCDGCNLAVHQDCYGVPYIPEGQWLCRKCTVSPENPVGCYLCPNEGGAFKQTTHGEWVHLLCAIWIPETRVANDVFMEPITGVEKISKQRWKLRCSICDIREGACIQCTKPSCFVAFHATCARNEKLLMPMKSVQGAEPASLTCYCDRHLPKEQQEIRAAALEGLEDEKHQGPNASKSARAYAKTYKPGPPLVPAIIINRIVQYIYRFKTRKKKDFVQQMARYWSLKREARRGAPLLKRLHLEPWTASAGTKVLTEEEKIMRLGQLKRLRQDLVNIYALTSLVRKREIRKQRQMETVYDVIAGGLFPSHSALRTAFEKIQGQDRNDYFKNPVSKNEVPDYFDVIKKPMCWSIIDAKLDNHQYWNYKEFRDDIELVVNNALLYNKAGTVFHKEASRIKHHMKSSLDALESFKLVHNTKSWSHVSKEDWNDGQNLLAVDENSPATGTSYIYRQPFGDLEPPVNVLELFLTSKAVKDGLNMEVDEDPLAALFNYEIAKMKPIPPTPPSPPPVTATGTAAVSASAAPTKTKKNKSKRDRKAEAERAKAGKEVKETIDQAARTPGWQEVVFDEKREDSVHSQGVLDASDFRIPRTRNAVAAAVAFEAEARVDSYSAPPSAPDLIDPSQPPERTPESAKIRKRASIASITQPSTPRVVDHVDNRDSFNMFNAGWILPPDQKRGGRTTTERQPLPPPRKRQKTEHSSSRLSVVSTAPSDSQPPYSDPIDIKPDISEHTDIPMDVDGYYRGQPTGKTRHELGSASRAPSILDDEVGGPHNVVRQPNGTVIIEKLDTPAIRRERNIRRRAEKQKQAAHGLPEDVSISASSSNLSATNQPSMHPASSSITSPSEPVRAVQPPDIGEDPTEDEAFGSDLSELSDDETEDNEPDTMGEGQYEPEISQELPKEEPVASPGPPRRPTRPKRPKKASKMDNFEDGTIVWAKSESYPWWPAVVHADTSPNVPGNILRVHKEKRQKRKIKLFIVQYYDKQASWQSVARDKLQLLGEDKKLDDDMLSPNSTRQKWKSAQYRQLCREAYETAISEMEVEDNPDQSCLSRPP